MLTYFFHLNSAGKPASFGRGNVLAGLGPKDLFDLKNMQCAAKI
jgi:hypothetical protein